MNLEKKIDQTNFDKEELLKRVSKYFIIGLIVFLSAFFVPENKLRMVEALFIGLSASAAFGVIDLFYPSVCIV